MPLNQKLAAEKLVVDSTELVSNPVAGESKLSFGGIRQADSREVNSIDIRVSKETSKRGSAIDSSDARVTTEEDTRSTNVDSLDIRVSKETSKRSSAVTSEDMRVSKETSKRGSAIDSSDARVTTEEDTRSTNVDSLDIRVSKETSKRSSAVDSVDARLLSEERTTQIGTVTLASGNAEKTVTYSALGFTAYGESVDTPAAAATLRYTGTADAPIVVAMQQGAASKTGATFVFSDTLENDDYVMDLIVSN
jgi:hypothetical protein